MKRREKPPLADRLDRAAREAGLSSEAVAERLGVTAGAVGHWRAGRNAPPLEVIAEFARVAGCSDYWLYTGRPDPASVIEELQGALAEFRSAVTAGEAPDAAWERITGRTDALTAEQRSLLMADPEGLRAYLAEPRGEDWTRLSDEQRRLVRELIRLFARAAPPDH